MGINVNDAFPSNYLKASDLQGREPNVTMGSVQFEKIGDDQKLILYFQGKEKGIVLNKTNATMIAELYGPDSDGWIGKNIKLVSVWVDFQGKQVQAIRVRPPDGQQVPGRTETPPPADPQSAPDFDDEIPF